MNPAWVAAVAAVAGVLLGVVGWVLRGAWRLFRKTDRFLEDWNGVPPDSVHEPRPGVLARLVALEHSVMGMQADLTDVQGQVHMNGGGSLRDEVKRTEAVVGQTQEQVSRLEGQMTGLQATVDEIRRQR